MNWTLLIPGVHEILTRVVGMSTSEVALVVGSLLWVVLLCLSLSGIDRRDAATGFTYVLYMMAAGATLLLALPGKSEAVGDYRQQMMLVCAMGALAAVRWIRHAKAPSKALKEMKDG